MSTLPPAPDISISFEFFPPKSEEAEAQLWRTIAALEPFAPRFVSVTYGAGGSTRERTHALVKRIRTQTPLSPAAHLTCVGASREEINVIAQNYWETDITHIVALRGDAPEGCGSYVPHPQGYNYADDLVRGLRDIADFEISVAAYPETHPAAPSAQADIDHLKRKFDAGATRAISQYFFEAEVFLRFVDRCRAAGITQPIVPGLMPIANFEQATRFSAMCGATIPSWMAERYATYEQPDDVHALSIELTTALCERLMKEGADELHFYTLNRASLVAGVCNNMAQ